MYVKYGGNIYNLGCAYGIELNGKSITIVNAVYLFINFPDEESAKRAYAHISRALSKGQRYLILDDRGKEPQ